MQIVFHLHFFDFARWSFGDKIGMLVLLGLKMIVDKSNHLERFVSIEQGVKLEEQNVDYSRYWHDSNFLLK